MARPGRKRQHRARRHPHPGRGRRLALSTDVAVSGDGGAAAAATGLPASGWRLLCVGRLWLWLQTRLHASRATIWTPRGAPMHSVQSRGVGIARVRRSGRPPSDRCWRRGAHSGCGDTPPRDVAPQATSTRRQSPRKAEASDRDQARRSVREQRGRYKALRSLPTTLLVCCDTPIVLCRAQGSGMYNRAHALF